MSDLRHTHYVGNHPLSARRQEVTMDGLLMKYFVLKPRGDDPYALASREAMRTYAEYIKNENPILAADLQKWVSQEAAR